MLFVEGRVKVTLSLGDETIPLMFDRAAAGRLQIGRHALETILRFQQSGDHDREAGGVLLGRYIIDTDDIVIDEVTTPQPGDRRSPHRFFRSRKAHQWLIDRAWSESNGRIAYLGEWHTHPEPHPHPSAVDRIGWTKKALLDRFAGSIFFLILGTDSMGVWEGKRFDVRVDRLREV